MPHLRLLRRFAPALLILLALAACERTVQRPVFPEIRFNDKAPLRLDVAMIEIDQQFRPTFREPNVEHVFPVPPARAVETWARDRLQAAGTSGRARVVINEAGVTETPLQRTPGVRGALTTDQAERYDGVLEVSVEIRNDRGFAERTATARATRSRTVAEGITPNQRDQVWYEMTRDLIRDVDTEMERQMRTIFGRYLQ